jgi:hypothetical protein
LIVQVVLLLALEVDSIPRHFEEIQENRFEIFFEITRNPKRSGKMKKSDGINEETMSQTLNRVFARYFIPLELRAVILNLAFSSCDKCLRLFTSSSVGSYRHCRDPSCSDGLIEAFPNNAMKICEVCSESGVFDHLKVE